MSSIRSFGKTQYRWDLFHVLGSSLRLENGVAGTLTEPAGHPPASFSGESTIILGTLDKKKMRRIPNTRASWEISVPRSVKNNGRSLHLVVGCLRKFGGLHSLDKGALVRMFFNSKPLEEFELLVIPEDHSDYFHRPTLTSKAPILAPFDACETVNMWPILPERLADTATQTVTLEIDRRAWWDIDYVGLLSRSRTTRKPIKTKLKVFLCHGKEDKPRVRKLYQILKSRGFEPWLDEIDLFGGEDWDVAIQRAIKAAHIVLVCLSRTSTTKTGFVQKEIKYALDEAEMKPDGTVYIIPVKFDDCKVPLRLSHRHWIDLSKRQGHAELIRSLKNHAEAFGVLSR